jgi:hypothetical protein
MKYYKLIATILMLLQKNILIGQTIPVPRAMEVYLQVLPSDTTNLFGDSIFSPNTQVKAKMVIILRDTINISSLNITVGSSANSTNLFQKNFTFDLVGLFNDGTSYERNGLIIYLGLGNFTGLNTFYSSIRLQSPSGYITSPIMYNN